MPEAGDRGLTVWPNPTGGPASVSLRGEPGSVRVSVVDARGREVALLHDGAARDGQRWTVDTGALAPGVYAVRAVTDAGAQVSAGLTVVR